MDEDNMTYIWTHGGREREHHKKLTNQKKCKVIQGFCNNQQSISFWINCGGPEKGRFGGF